MTNAQLLSFVIALSVTPLATCLVVLLEKTAGQRYLNDLNAEITVFRVKVDARLDRLQTEGLARMDELDERIQKIDQRCDPQ